jgi:predicted DNA-binding transcriptional regulator AlpA
MTLSLIQNPRALEAQDGPQATVVGSDTEKSRDRDRAVARAILPTTARSESIHDESGRPPVAVEDDLPASQVPDLLGRKADPHPGRDADLPGRKLKVQEAARFLGLSVSTLNKLRLSGNGPPYMKLGRRVLYDLRDLEAWAAERKRNHTSERSPASMPVKPLAEDCSAVASATAKPRSRHGCRA